MPITIAPDDLTGRFVQGTDGKLFVCGIKWIISGAQSGFIVQHVQRNEKYEAKDDLGKKLDVVSGLDYWEAWEIKDNKALPANSEGFNDIFMLKNLNESVTKDKKVRVFPPRKGTAGKWKIRGTVYYVSTAEFNLKQWWRYNDVDSGTEIKQDGSVKEAARLLSRYDEPKNGDGLADGGKLGNPVCVREFAGAWDWTKPDPVSKARDFPKGASFRTAIKGFKG